MIYCDGDLSHGHIIGITITTTISTETGASSPYRSQLGNSPLPALQRPSAIRSPAWPCVWLFAFCARRHSFFTRHAPCRLTLFAFYSAPHLACLCCISFCPLACLPFIWMLPATHDKNNVSALQPWPLFNSRNASCRCVTAMQLALPPHHPDHLVTAVTSSLPSALSFLRGEMLAPGAGTFCLQGGANAAGDSAA